MTPPALDPVGRLREVVLDAPDPHALARFWAAVLGGEPVEWYPGWVTLEPPPGPRVSFQASAGQRPPTWPEGDLPAQVHVDVLVDDLSQAHERVVDLGAEFLGEYLSPRPGPRGAPVPWRVYRDPAGHPFCLVVR